MPVSAKLANVVAVQAHETSLCRDPLELGLVLEPTLATWPRELSALSSAQGTTSRRMPPEDSTSTPTRSLVLHLSPRPRSLLSTVETERVKFSACDTENSFVTRAHLSSLLLGYTGSIRRTPSPFLGCQSLLTFSNSGALWASCLNSSLPVAMLSRARTAHLDPYPWPHNMTSTPHPSQTRLNC